MYGWRGKIGLVVPSTNFTVEMEFHGAVPPGVSVHTARCVLNDAANTPEERVQAIIDMGKEVATASRQVADVRPGVIAWACTAGSFMKGLSHDIELTNSIERATGIKAVTTSTAVVNALKTLSVKKIAVATPYIQSICEEEKAFLENNIKGLTVLKIQGLSIMKGFDKGKLGPYSSYASAKEVNSDEAEAIFISCTAWRTFDVIELIERDLRKPVISSNEATLWACLKELGIQGVKGFGSLLASL